VECARNWPGATTYLLQSISTGSLARPVLILVGKSSVCIQKFISQTKRLFRKNGCWSTSTALPVGGSQLKMWTVLNNAPTPTKKTAMTALHGGGLEQNFESRCLGTFRVLRRSRGERHIQQASNLVPVEVVVPLHIRIFPWL
jgi:hypothetical protein